jgi:hypothetical protein
MRALVTEGESAALLIGQLNIMIATVPATAASEGDTLEDGPKARMDSSIGWVIELG